MRERVGGWCHTIGFHGHILAESFRKYRGRAVALFFLSILLSADMIVSVKFTEYLTNQAFHMKDGGFSGFLAGAAAFLGVRLGFKLLQWIYDRLFNEYDREVSIRVNESLLKKLSCIKYEYFENTETYQLIHKAGRAPDGFVSVMDIFGSLLNCGINLAVYTVILRQYNPLYMAALIGIYLLAALAVRNASKKYEGYYESEVVPLQRRKLYFEGILADRIRHSNIQVNRQLPFFRKEYEKYADLERKSMLKCNLLGAAVNFFSGLVFSAFSVFVVISVMKDVVKGNGEIGMVTAVCVILFHTYAIIQGLTDFFLQSKEYMHNIEAYERIMGLEETGQEGVQRENVGQKNVERENLEQGGAAQDGMKQKSSEQESVQREKRIQKGLEEYGPGISENKAAWAPDKAKGSDEKTLIIDSIWYSYQMGMAEKNRQTDKYQINKYQTGKYQSGKGKPGKDSEEGMWVVKGLSGKFYQGEKVAVVGENGSGKTTLIQILLGLLENQKGEICNTVGKAAAILQDFPEYAMSVRENIELGRGGMAMEDEEIVDILKKVELWDYIRTLPEGINTQIGQLAEGTEFSKGQFQRLAVGRLLADREADIWILDEPTAYLDPVAEIEMYKNILELGKEKLIFFISHRLGFARMADRIIVVEDGHITEQGNHAGLMKQKGKYAAMYEMQRSWYEA